MGQNLTAMVEEMRRQRRAQLDSILSRQTPSSGGLSPMQAQPGRQHGDPKQNISSLYQGYNALSAKFPNALPSIPSVSSLVGSLPQAATLGVGAGAAAPSLAAGTFSSIPAGAAVSAGPFAAGTAVPGAVGGTGALGALSSMGSAIGGAASAVGGAAASAGSSIVSLLASLL